MNKQKSSQISISEFYSPFGDLNKNNRWFKIAEMIPWDYFEEIYKKQFSEDNGAPAIHFRMALGTLLIKQLTGHSDDEGLEDILESPYKQYLIGLHEFTTKPPFAQSSITNFRKYIPAEMMDEINNLLFRKNDNPPGANSGGGSGSEEGESVSAETPALFETVSAAVNLPIPPSPSSKNRGTLMLDATCAPSDIAYPTDINLLNEAREKLEAMIDTLYPCSSFLQKPRTYREVARKEYLVIAVQRNPGYEKIREAIGGQLAYVKRNLGHIDNLLQTVSISVLTNPQQQWLDSIRTLYKQQLYMYENNTHTIENRIVSIGQPHVRPIKRGKARAPYEFGAKISISLVDGYAFVDQLGWDSYNEESQLIPAVEAYKCYYGFYPERVLADQIYRNKNNRNYCKERGIRLSGPRLGRPPKETDPVVIKQQARDSADRSAIEGKFGEGKQKYGLGRIMARLKDSCETVISLAFLCMNIKRRLRVLLKFFILKFVFVFQAESPTYSLFYRHYLFTWVFV